MDEEKSYLRRLRIAILALPDFLSRFALPADGVLEPTIMPEPCRIPLLWEHALVLSALVEGLRIRVHSVRRVVGVAAHALS